MYTIIIKYFSYNDDNIYIEEVQSASLESAPLEISISKDHSILVLSASYKDECAVIKDSINEE